MAVVKDWQPKLGEPCPTCGFVRVGMSKITAKVYSFDIEEALALLREAGNPKPPIGHPAAEAAFLAKVAS